jgi:transcriptional regulator with XRE-family HTH domain
MFGDFIRDKRLARDLTLREFCRQTGEDPSNWSKVERGLLAPPQSTDKLNQIARDLGIRKNGQDYKRLVDEAAVTGGRIPKDLMSNKALVGLLPAFLRTVGNTKPTKEDIMKLMKKLEEER